MDVFRKHRRNPLVLFATAVVLGAGCSSIFTRGLVDDGHGNPVGGAEIRVLDETGTAVLALDRTDSHGCFLVSVRAPKGQQRYTLDVEAAGFKPARQEFDLRVDLLVAGLAPPSSPEPSRIRVATSSERADRWIPNCAPPLTMGSDALTPN